MAFPEEWKASNQKQVVEALRPAQDAAIVLSLTGSRNPEEAAKRFSQQEGVTVGAMQSIEVRSGQGVLLPFRAQADVGVMNGMVAFIAYQGKVYQIKGYSPAAPSHRCKPSSTGHVSLSICRDP